MSEWRRRLVGLNHIPLCKLTTHIDVPRNTHKVTWEFCNIQHPQPKQWTTKGTENGKKKMTESSYLSVYHFPLTEHLVIGIYLHRLAAIRPEQLICIYCQDNNAGDFSSKIPFPQSDYKKEMFSKKIRKGYCHCLQNNSYYFFFQKLDELSKVVLTHFHA